MTNTSVFYNKEDVWKWQRSIIRSSSDAVDVKSGVSDYEAARSGRKIFADDPYTPQNKDNMVAWMAGICDGDDYGKLIVYEFSKAESCLRADAESSRGSTRTPRFPPQLTLLSQEGSECCAAI
jgi:uncharacterized membrane protein (UPF0182 family)